VANYSVDIEVALKGVEKLREFDRVLGHTLGKVEELQKAYASIKQTNPYDVAGARQVTESDRQRLSILKEIAGVLREHAQIQSNTARQNLEAQAQGKRELQESLRLLEERQHLESMLGRGPSNEELNRRAQDIQDAIDNAAQAEFEARRRVAELEAKLDEQSALKQAKLDQIEHEKRLDNLEKEAKREQQLNDATHRQQLRQFDDRLRAAQQKRQAAQQLQEDLLLGAGFPLLFGGGPGAVLGGAAGALVGGGAGGFAFQIGLSAIGQQLDIATESARSFVKALRENGNAVGYLEENLGSLDPELKKTISNLQQAGQTAKAATLTKAQLAKVVGDEGVVALERFGLASEKLQNKLKELSLVGLVELAKLSTFFGNLFFGAGPRTQLGEDVTGQVRAAARARQQDLELTRLQAEAAGVSSEREFDRYQTLQKRIATQERDKAITDAREKLNVDQDIARYNDERNKAQIQYEGRLRQLELERRDRELNINKELTSSSLRVQEAALNFQIKRTNAQSQVLQLGKTEIERLGIQREENTRLYTLQKQLLDIRLKQNLVGVREQQVRSDLVRVHSIELKQLKDTYDLQTAITNERERQLKLQESQNAILRRGAVKEQRESFQMQLFRLQAATNPAFTGPYGNISLMQQTQSMEMRSELGRRQREIELRKIDVEKGTATQADVNNLIKLKDEYILYQTQVNKASLAQEHFNTTLSFTRPVTDSIFEGFIAVAQSTRTAEEAFASFMRGIASILFDTAKQLIAQYIAIGIARKFAGIPSISGSFNTTATSATGAGILNPATMFDAFGFTGKAAGGPVSAGRPYLVGERGPELFMPRTSGSIYPNDAIGGGGANITVNVDASGSSVQGNTGQAGQLAQAVASAVQAELIKQQRPGGLLRR